MAVLVQKEAPDFAAQAVMPEGSFRTLQLSDYRGQHVVLFFYPLDFTFVCPTEVIAFSDRIAEFQNLGVQVLGVSVDSQYTHFAWRNTARTEGGVGQVTYPLVADLNKKIAQSYDVLTDSGVALRASFLIDRQGIVRHQLVNDLPLGRSVDETLRMVGALRCFEKYGEFCPADWEEGEQTIKPNVDQSKDFFSAAYAP